MGLTVKNVVEWINKFAAKIEQNKQFLSDLDTAIGDGDHGFNMSRGMIAVSQKLNSEPKTIKNSGVEHKKADRCRKNQKWNTVQVPRAINRIDQI